jgi:hypothetical protein
MVDVIIGVFGTSFRAIDTTVKINDQVQITTNDPNTNFKVVVPNTDGFFSTALDSIVGTVNLNTPLVLGFVTGNGKATKYYEFYPGITAPPRIIRES